MLLRVYPTCKFEVGFGESAMIQREVASLILRQVYKICDGFLASVMVLFSGESFCDYLSCQRSERRHTCRSYEYLLGTNHDCVHSAIMSDGSK
jgi:hypothetical protein